MTKAEIKYKIQKAQELKRAISWHHPNDDDPTGQFYTVKEQRRSLRDKITKLKEQLKEAKS